MIIFICFTGSDHITYCVVKFCRTNQNRFGYSVTKIQYDENTENYLFS